MHMSVNIHKVKYQNKRQLHKPKSQVGLTLYVSPKLNAGLSVLCFVVWLKAQRQHC